MNRTIEQIKSILQGTRRWNAGPLALFPQALFQILKGRQINRCLITMGG